MFSFLLLPPPKNTIIFTTLLNQIELQTTVHMLHFEVQHMFLNSTYHAKSASYIRFGRRKKLLHYREISAKMP